MTLRTQTVVWLWILIGGSSILAHDHINGGALSNNLGSALVFSNGDRYSTSRGWVQFLDGKDETGSWQVAEGLTFGALPASVSTGGPVVGHAALGSFLELEFVDLTGPRGATMSVWERDEDFGSLTQLLQMEAGESAGGQRMRVSEGDGSPTADPYGHIHGREFWVNQPGLYVVRLRLVDTSTQGPNGGPIHTPSGILSLYLQAQNTLQVEWNKDTGLRVTYAVRGYETWIVEESSTMAEGATWREVHRAGGSTHGFLATCPITEGDATRFYRLQQVTGF